jgi:uncharacterized protein YjbI with pentapeptide repeats
LKRRNEQENAENVEKTHADFPETLGGEITVSQPFMKHIYTRTQQLLDRSLAFRLVLALLAAYMALFVVQEIEAIHRQTSCWGTATFFICLWDELTDLIAVENVEGFSILVVAIIYLIEGRDRQKQKHYEAWQVIDNAAAANVPTSNARIQALQDLNEDGVSLQEIDLPGADLKRIQLAGANLREATLNQTDLRNAILTAANLQASILSQANLRSADLSHANLAKANLKGADLTNANLSGANLTCANLSSAILEGANLSNAILSQSNLAAANLRAANLRYANLREAKLRESDFRAADLKDAKLTGAVMPDGTVHE